jgi:hypothetical protein
MSCVATAASMTHDLLVHVQGSITIRKTMWPQAHSNIGLNRSKTVAEDNREVRVSPATVYLR